MGKNNNLIKAKKEKNDEFYTQYEDIEKELKHYTEHLKDKIIYCNCDDPSFSNFYKYFSDNFKSLGLKKLITTHFVKDGKSYKLEIDEQGITKTPLNGDGDFRSNECIEILKTADVVITNPPFSLFREFVATLIKYNKKLLVIGNYNATTYKDIFEQIKNNKIWLGKNFVKSFLKASGEVSFFGNICWFTNIPNLNRNNTLNLTSKFNKEKYPKYDNCDAIEVRRVKDIPNDYYELMGVPSTFLEKYNPEQFKILCLNQYDENNLVWRGKDLILNGNIIYTRIIIKRIEI